MTMNGWSTIKLNDMTVYIADRPSQASRGLAGVAPSEFTRHDALYFICVKPEWGDFDNLDHGHGTVSFDISIAFLRGDGIVLDIVAMSAHTGCATPPRGTNQAIEARPEWFADMGFEVGKASPLLVRLAPHRSRDSGDCYFDLCTGQ